MGARLLAFAVALALALCAAAANPVVVIRGDKSLPDAGERRFAASLANHAVRWFKDGGLAVDQDSDADLAKALSGRKVAVLVYCANPPAAQIASLRKFVSSGGRLIVVYSSSQALGDIVGVKVGGYRKTPGVAAMRFVDGRPPNIASRISQASANIVTASPGPKSRVLAWWEDRSGKRTGDAAWIAGPGGYWMTHVLLADGDARDKGRLLVALSASIAPELWMTAAKKALEGAGNVGPWRGTGSALDYIAKLKQGPRCARARQEVASAEEARRNAVKMLGAGRGAEAWLLANESRQLLCKAYGIIQSPSRGEIHAVWDHSGMGLYPGDWPRTCKTLAAAGVTDILVNVAAPGFAHCDIATLPHSDVFTTYGDQLAACLAAARRHGIRVHAWLICFSATGASKHRLDVFARNGWLLQSTDGTRQNWLDPSSADARRHIVAAAGEILSKYKVDGLHLDFVRYQDYFGSLGSVTKARFERDVKGGKPTKNWSEAARHRPLFAEIVRWRAKQVTALVADIRATQRKVAPNVLLSAAVLGRYPTCVESVGQDWMSWLELGYLDYAMPMNYTEDGALYSELLAAQLKKKAVARKIVGGIGVTASESRLGPDRVIDQVKELRKGGAAGFALFDLDMTLVNDVFPILELGVTAK